MKISMVSEHASPLAAMGEPGTGAQNVHVAELSAGLARAGHDVTVFTRRDHDGTPERVRTAEGYTVVRVPVGPPKYLSEDEQLPLMGQFGAFLEREWDADRPNVVHAHFWMSGIATQLATRTLGIPVVQTFHSLGVAKHRHEGPADDSPASRIRLEQLIARGATRLVVTCSEEMFELTHLGIPRSRASVVPSGVDVAEFTPDGPTESRGKKHRLVAVGRLVPHKGFDVAIEALAQLPQTELIIAGCPAHGDVTHDPEAARLRSLANDFKVGSRVSIRGQISRPDLAALLRSADVVVCPPWYEPFGMVALEAMACGTPVVATAVGGMRDTVVDGITGRLVPPQSPKRLADAIRQLIDNDAMRTGCGAAGCDRARARYSWDRIAADTLRAYGRCVTAPPKTLRSVSH